MRHYWKVNINYLLVLLTVVFMIFNFACGKNKQSLSNLTDSTGEGERYAASQLGKDARVLIKGDLNSNGNEDILAAIVNKNEGKDRFWIQKGRIFEYNNGWITILRIDKKLSSLKGNLVGQVEANNGYIISFDPNEKPMDISISIADSTGISMSDEAELQWNGNENSYDFISSPGSVQNNAP